ncbi:MAG: F0F1 ATP synthase subunit epsilon [Caulobacteraceae bacterium]
MRLLITDPVMVAADHTDVVAVRAEDESGSFGVLEGHADLLTTLSLSVVSWRHADGRTGYCAVRRGVFAVQGGKEVLIASREAHPGEDLNQLAHDVLAGYRARDEAERSTRTSSAKLRMQAIRRIVEALHGGGTSGLGQ